MSEYRTAGHLKPGSDVRNPGKICCDVRNLHRVCIKCVEVTYRIFTHKNALWLKALDFSLNAS